MAVAVVDVRVDSSSAVRNLQQISSAGKSTESALGGITKALGPLLAAFSAVQAAQFVFAKTAELETQTRSLQTLTGSAEQAKQIIAELQQLGAVTPFTSTELIDAAKRLQAFGVEAKNVVETTRRLADVSGATGAELQGLVTAYGQVQAKGRLQGEELLQFQERGIALQGELRKMYGLTGEEFQKALSKGQISAEAVEVAIVRLTEKGGKYANGAIAQSDTLAGKFSTLTDGIEQLARTIGQVLEPALKRVLGVAIDTLNNINAALAAGRMGDFRRDLAATRAVFGSGATSQGIDRIAFGISQVSSQKNKTGIEQNLQMLREYQAVLGSIRAEQIPDPQYQQKLLDLQGQIFRKINENLAALKKLESTPRVVVSTAPPPLLTPSGTGTGTGTKAKTASKDAEQTRADMLRESSLQLKLAQAQYELEGRILSARQDGYQPLVLAREAQAKLLQITYEANKVAMDKTLPAAEKGNKLAVLKIQAQTVARQLAFDVLSYEQERVKAAAGAMQSLEDELKLQNAKLYGVGEEYALNLQIRDLKVQYPALNEADIRTTLKKTQALKQQLSAAEELKALYSDIGMSIKSGVVDAIQGAIDGTKSLQQVAVDLLNSIANKLLDVAVNMALFGAMSGTGTGGGLLGGLFKPRAMGGSVRAGQPYLVGERGPELFMPGRSGGIAPTGSFGGGAVNVTVNVTTGGSSVQGDQAQGKQLGLAISAAVQSELIKQKRPGGLLA